MVKIVLGNITSRIVGYLPEIIHTELNNVLSYRVANAHYIPSVKYKKWDGVFRLYSKNKGQSFYSGLLSLVAQVLEKHKIEFQKIDGRICPEINMPSLKFSPAQGYEERDYQQFTIDRAISRTRGILKIGTGGGKTMIVSEMISRIKTAPFMFYVLTQDLMEQAYDNLSTVLNEPIGRIGGGIFDIQKINICTVQTAVRAINLNNKKFKISDYQFDEDDVWDKKNIESDEKLMILKDLISKTQGIYLDECHHTSCKSVIDVMNASPHAFWKYGGSVGPESFIELRGGLFGAGFVGTIEDAFKLASSTSKHYVWNDFQIIDFKEVYARGWEKDKFIWKKCDRILRHNGKPCLNIEAQGTKLLITPEHSVYYAKSKQVENNKKLTVSEIECASASKLVPKNILIGDDGNGFSTGCSSRINMVDFCIKYMQKSRVTVHCNVKEIERFMLKDIGGTPKTIYNWRKRGGIPINLFVKIKNPPEIKYLTTEGSSSKISCFVNVEDWAYILGFYLGDGWLSGNKVGFSVDINRKKIISDKLKCLQGVTWNIRQRQMPGKSVELLGNNPFVFHLLYCFFGKSKCNEKRIPGEFIINWTILAKKQFIQGLLDSDGNVEIGKFNKKRYTYCTTSKMLAKELCSLLRSIGLWGSITVSAPKLGGVINGRQIVGKLHKYSVRWTEDRAGIKRSEKQSALIHNNIEFIEVPVRKIVNGHTPEWIYDLEMSGHPSFVADGLLVHNSATPWREDGAEIMIQAMFGKKIVDINASYLINKNFLLKPYILFDPICDPEGSKNLHVYSSIYKNCISSNDEFNNRVIKIAEYLIENKKTVLILVQQYAQGEYIQKALPQLDFLTGKMNRASRKNAIQNLRNGEKQGIIGTTLFDEGVDCPVIDCVLIAGGGASSTRMYQRIGRALRKSGPDKDKALIVYFSHDAKYLSKHSKKVLKILKMEPSFEIINSCGENFTFDAIDEVFGIKNKDRKNLFESL